MTGRTWVNLNWERAADGALSAYLSIARPGQAAERIPLPLPAVAQLLADGAMLWSVVEPMRQGPGGGRSNPAAVATTPCPVSMWHMSMRPKGHAAGST